MNIDEINNALVRVKKAIVRMNIDEINNALVRVKKAIEPLFDELEPYQRYELLHSQKKPRGSIRRKRRNRWKIDLS